MAVLPNKFQVARLIAVVVAITLAMLYAALIGSYWANGKGDFGSLAGVGMLFSRPPLLLAGWVHYLCFDLLVGTWEREEAIAIGLPRWLLLPCLVLTFMFGPVGFLLFMALRLVRNAMRARLANPVIA